MSDVIGELLETGYRLQVAGKLGEAEAHYRAVLERDPRNVHALNLLGVICINTDRARQAVDFISVAIGENADDAEAYSNLGLAQTSLRQLDAACRSFSAAARLDPHNPVRHNNLGNVLAQLSRYDDAVSHYRRALHLDPNYAECLCNLAGSLTELGQLKGALAAADRAIHLNPAGADGHNKRGEVLLKQARFDEAARSFRAAIRLQENFAAAMINLSIAYKESGSVAEARSVLDTLLSKEPDNPRAIYHLGLLLEQLGDGDAAARHFRQTIALSPGYATAYYQLAQLRGKGLDDQEVQTVLGFLDDASLSNEQRTLFLFALACAYESRKEYDRSFSYLEQAQALKAAENPYDDGDVGKYHASIQEEFGRTEKSTAGYVPEHGPRPIFVLGMPRSGTSLVEQILASHPAIYGAGELSFMEDTVAEAKKLADVPYPECLRSLTSMQWCELGRRYLDRIAARSEGELMVVDKTPMNFQYIGFIANALPEARFVHCLRDPRDNCLSIFQRPFETSHSYAHSLQSLGQYYKNYRKLMEFWSSVLGDRILDMQYENVVADTENQARQLLEFVGVPFDERVLSFHKTERIVKTPSASQVRYPIYTTAIAGWKKYSEHLNPLTRHLGEFDSK